MIITPEYLNSIKPKKRGQCDKFSWNIYRYLKEKCMFDIQVCWYEKSWIDGSVEHFSENNSLRNVQTFILFGGHYSGARILDLQSKGNSSTLETYSFCAFDKEKFIDITEWFLKRYQQIGRCIFDLEHGGWWSGEGDRFTVINKKSRRCNWCGQYQRKSIIKQVNVIKRREVWA